MTTSKFSPLLILMIIVIIALIGIVIYLAANNVSGQSVAVGDTINVSYTGTLTNGTVFDTNVGKAPLRFTVGSGELIQGFDQGVIGMKVNQEKTITIPANEAYGPVNPTLIIEVPSNSFGNQTAQIGMAVGRNVSGQQEQGVVTAVNKTTVTLDFNPPLAGQTLIFKIKVLSITKG